MIDRTDRPHFASELKQPLPRPHPIQRGGFVALQRDHHLLQHPSPRHSSIQRHCPAFAACRHIPSNIFTQRGTDSILHPLRLRATKAAHRGSGTLCTPKRKRPQQDIVSSQGGSAETVLPRVEEIDLWTRMAETSAHLPPPPELTWPVNDAQR